jgi:phage protein D
MHGGDLDDELKRRTLQFLYVDSDKGVDEIEWSLDNSDGLLTDPKYLAIGLTIRMRLGYVDGTTPWRAFIINRARGGLGVTGNNVAPLTESTSVITYTGHNRKGPLPKSGKKRKNARPTASIINYELMLNPPEGSRSFPGAVHVSDAIIEIAKICGFTDDYIYVEETRERASTGISMRSDDTYGEFILRWAKRFNYIFKIDARGFHWHSSRWALGSGKGLREVFTFGDGQDILDLRFDGDFRLQVPTKVEAKTYDADKRLLLVEGAIPEGGVDPNIHAVIIEGSFDRSAKGQKERAANLQRVEVIPSPLSYASAKAQATYVKRHERAFKIGVDVVGNPRVLATDLIQLKGVGSIFADKLWYVRKAKHLFRGKDYMTRLACIHPPKTKAVQKRVLVLMEGRGTPEGTTPEVHAATFEGSKQSRLRFGLQ